MGQRSYDRDSDILRNSMAKKALRVDPLKWRKERRQRNYVCSSYWHRDRYEVGDPLPRRPPQGRQMLLTPEYASCFSKLDGTRQVYPTLLLVLVVCFMYAVISPFIVPAGAIFFGFAYIVYKHQVHLRLLLPVPHPCSPCHLPLDLARGGIEGRSSR